MELRGRPRGYTWSSLTMAKSKDKEWQEALENMGGKVMDGMEKYFEKMMKKLEEKEEKTKQERR